MTDGRRSRACLAATLVLAAAASAAGGAGSDDGCAGVTAVGFAADAPARRLRPAPLGPPARVRVRYGAVPRSVRVYVAAAAPAGAGARAVIVGDSGTVLWSGPLGAAGGPAAASGRVDYGELAFLRRSDGTAYRAYFGDSAGRIWRLELLSPVADGPAAARWRVLPLATLADRRGTGPGFTVRPELFRGIDGAGEPFDGVLLAGVVSAAGTERIDLFLLRDYVVAGARSAEAVVAGRLADAGACTADEDGCPPAVGPGWRLEGAARGDTLAGGPLLDGGRIYLASYLSASVDCESGTAQRFAAVVDLATAAAPATLPPLLDIGRGAPAEPALDAGGIDLPGLPAALRAVAPRGAASLAPSGPAVRRLYWRDLMLDAD